MDRRQQKTRDAIFRAFSALLSRKRYERITVQEIIDEANICRSTFYTHFETKDMLLKAMCSDIFDHIFAGNMCDYDHHADNLESKLAHILWHLSGRRADVAGILSSESGSLFMGYLREYLTTLFTMHLNDFSADVPPDYLLSHLVGSFSETVQWWVKNGMEPAPEEMARRFASVTGWGCSE